MNFVLFSMACIAIGFIAWCILFAFLKDGDFLTVVVIPILIFLVISVGGLVLGTIIFEEELELAKEGLECTNICEDQGLEFVSYTNRECFCREPKTLCNICRCEGEKA